MTRSTRWFLTLFLSGFGCAANLVHAQPTPTGTLDPFHLYELKIRFADKHWENRLKAYKSTDRKEKIPATVWFDGVRLDSVGIRFKGNSSFNSVRKEGRRKLPFSMDAGEFMDGQAFPVGLDQLKLSNGYLDPSGLREVVSYAIARDFMPAPECAMAKVFVNDEYFGVYTLTQDIDKDFLKTWFGEKGGTFFKCDPDWDKCNRNPPCPAQATCSLEDMGPDLICYEGRYELKSDKGWPDLYHLVRSLNQPDSIIERILDVDQTLWLLAYNDLLVNLDSYSGQLCHNYFLYQREDGRFVPLIWDLNLSFGGFTRADKGKLDLRGLIELDPLLHAFNPERPLIQRLLAVPLYRKMYLAHMQTIQETWFANGTYRDFLHKVFELVRPAVKAETMSLYPFELFEKNQSATVTVGPQEIIGITSLMEKRIGFLKDHVMFGGAAPEMGTPVISSPGPDSLLLDCPVADSTATMVLFWRPSGTQTWQDISSSIPEGLPDTDGQVHHRFFLSPVNGQIDYFLVLEGETRATVWPERGAFRPAQSP